MKSTAGLPPSQSGSFVRAARWLPRLPAAVWLALLLAHGLALGYALRTGHYTFPDTDRYLQAAQNIEQHGQLYARPWPASPPTGQAVQEFSIRPPGYPLLVLALGEPLGVLIYQNTLSVWVLALVLGDWSVTRSRLPGRGAWVVALALALSFPAQFIYANALMSELPLQAVLLLGAGLAAAFGRGGRARYLAGVAATLTAGWLLKPVLAPFTVVFLLIAAWLAWRQRRPRLALLGVLPLVVVLAYMGWNWQRTGYFHFSSITDINLLHYNAAGVLRQAQGPAAEEAWVAHTLRVANAQPTFAARQRIIGVAASAVLRQYPLRYASQHLLGMGVFFLDPGRFDMSVFTGQNHTAGWLAQLRGRGLAGVAAQLEQQPLAWLLLLAVTGLANAIRLALALLSLCRPPLENSKPMGWLGLNTRGGRWLAAGLLLYLALLTGPLGAARFLVPAWPLLLALALRGLPVARRSLRP